MAGSVSSAAEAASLLTQGPVADDAEFIMSSVVEAGLSLVEPLTVADLKAIVEKTPGDGGMGAPQAVAAAVVRLMGDPWDITAWEHVLIESRNTGDFGRELALRAMTKQFPTSGKVWHDLISYQLQQQEKRRQQRLSEKKEDSNDVDTVFQDDANDGDNANGAVEELATARIDADWLRAMRLTGFANLDLWKLDLERALGEYEKASRERDTALQQNRQASKADSDRAMAARNNVISKFDKCLQRVGQDFRAGPLWERYLEFVKSWPNLTSAERNERLKMLRYIYQSGCRVALRAVDKLWQQYESFERFEVEGNEDLGPQLIDKHRPDYQKSSQWARERGMAWEAGVGADALEDRVARLAVPPTGSTEDEHTADENSRKASTKQKKGSGLADGTAGENDKAVKPLDSKRYADDIAQLKAWRSRLSYEASNPERLDAANLRQRVVHSFEQCAAAMRFYPEIWADYAAFELSLPDAASAHWTDQDRADASASAERGGAGGDGRHRAAPPTSRARAEGVYKRALVALPHCTLLHLAYAELLEGGSQEDLSSSSSSSRVEGGTLANEVARIEAARAVYVGLVKTMPSSDMAWALYQRFTRRVDGKAAARGVFRITKQARLDEELGHHIYLAHALLEWYANGEPETALRVFRYATAKHPACLLASDFVLCFAECLVSLGQHRDARSLYERALAAMATAVAEFYAALPIGTHGPAGSTGGMGLVTDGAGVVTPEQFATRDWRAVLPSPGPRPLWLAYMRFEVLHASSSRDGARLRRLEARMLKALPPGSSVDEMAAAAAAAARDTANAAATVKQQRQQKLFASGGQLDKPQVSSLSAADNVYGDTKSAVALGVISRATAIGSSEEALQRLWWRHAPPGLEPSACATATDTALYGRWGGLPLTFASSYAGPNDVHGGASTAQPLLSNGLVASNGSVQPSVWGGPYRATPRPLLVGALAMGSLSSTSGMNNSAAAAALAADGLRAAPTPSLRQNRAMAVANEGLANAHATQFMQQNSSALEASRPGSLGPPILAPINMPGAPQRPNSLQPRGVNNPTMPVANAGGMNVPPFLAPLCRILPQAAQGQLPDNEFVMQLLLQGQTPPQSFGGSQVPTLGMGGIPPLGMAAGTAGGYLKRGAGEMESDDDRTGFPSSVSNVFRQRQQARLG